jgi:hypothetical protein
LDLKGRKEQETGENYTVGSFIIYILQQYYWNDQTKDADKKRSLGRYSCRCKYNINIDIKYIVREGVDWVHLARDKVQWRAFGNTVMDLRVP